MPRTRSAREPDAGEVVIATEAAKLPGVSPPTVSPPPRRWDDLPARRRPLDAYGLYARDDVLNLRTKIGETAAVRMSERTPRLFRGTGTR